MHIRAEMRGRKRNDNRITRGGSLAALSRCGERHTEGESVYASEEGCAQRQRAKEHKRSSSSSSNDDDGREEKEEVEEKKEEVVVEGGGAMRGGSENNKRVGKRRGRGAREGERGSVRVWQEARDPIGSRPGHIISDCTPR